MPFPPTQKTMEGFLRDAGERLTLVERRLATGGGGSSDIEPTYDSGWVDLTPLITWGTGWSYVPDPGPSPGVKARRVGAHVFISIANARIAAGTFTVPTSGNIANSTIFTGLPAEFRPATGVNGALASGTAGPTASATMTPSGVLYLSAMAPDSTLTASTAIAQTDFSWAGSYMADGSKPLGPAAVVEDTPVPPYDALAGMISPWAGTSIPSGWLLCDGSAVSRTTYSPLFTVIGTTYGAGDGSTTFNLPNLKGRVPFGQDTTQGEFDVLGESGGAKTHNHPLSDLGIAVIRLIAQATNNITMRRVGVTPFKANTHQNSLAAGASANTATDNSGAALSGTTDDASSLPPYLVTRYIISTGEGVGGGGSTALPGRLGGSDGDLLTLPAGTDLNNITTTGWFIQRLSVQATLALNYPVARAGHLTVSASMVDSDYILQTYIEYAPASPYIVAREWRRTHYLGNWTGWTLVSDDTGWISLVPLLANSFTAGTPAPAYRIKNGVVYLTGILYRATAPTAFTVVLNMPAEIQAPTQFRVLGRTDHALEFAITNSIQLKANAAATSGIGWALDGISWIPIGM